MDKVEERMEVIKIELQSGLEEIHFIHIRIRIIHVLTTTIQYSYIQNTKIQFMFFNY